MLGSANAMQDDSRVVRFQCMVVVRSVRMCVQRKHTNRPERNKPTRPKTEKERRRDAARGKSSARARERRRRKDDAAQRHTPHANANATQLTTYSTTTYFARKLKLHFRSSRARRRPKNLSSRHTIHWAPRALNSTYISPNQIKREPIHACKQTLPLPHLYNTISSISCVLRCYLAYSYLCSAAVGCKPNRPYSGQMYVYTTHTHTHTPR